MSRSVCGLDNFCKSINSVRKGRNGPFRRPDGLGTLLRMITIYFTDANATERSITVAEEGLSLMEVAKEHGIEGIMADCGGACSCATCHVFIDQQDWDRVGPPDDIEFAMLDMVADVARPNSRLSCQIKLSAALDGLRVTVAPDGGF